MPPEARLWTAKAAFLPAGAACRPSLVSRPTGQTPSALPNRRAGGGLPLPDRRAGDGLPFPTAALGAVCPSPTAAGGEERGREGEINEVRRWDTRWRDS